MNDNNNFREMGIFKVSLPRELYLGYDSYSSFIVVAESETAARNIHPGSEMLITPERDWDKSWIKFSDIGKLIVEKVGIYTGFTVLTEPKILLACFHAS